MSFAGRNGESGTWTERELDQLLGTAASGSVGSTEALPPPSSALMTAIAASERKSPRVPAKRLALLVALGALQVGGMALALGLRREITELPKLWYGAYLAAWALSFVALGWATQIPPKGRVMPRAWFGAFGLVAAVLFMAGGVLFAEDVPGRSTMYEPTFANVLHYAPYCTSVGLASSILPIILAGFLLRGATPRGARRIGLGVGAAAGSLGGLTLHLHCPIAEGTHLGFVHGGVVAIAALAGAFAVPLISRLRS